MGLIEEFEELKKQAKTPPPPKDNSEAAAEARVEIPDSHPVGGGVNDDNAVDPPESQDSNHVSNGTESSQDASADGLVNGGIAFFITNRRKACLRILGYTDQQIAIMQPAEAARIVSGAAPSRDDWALTMSQKLKEALDKAIRENGEIGKAVINADAIRATLESLRNQPSNRGTWDPEELSDTDIAEDLDFLAGHYDKQYNPPQLEPPEPEEEDNHDKLKPLKLGELFSLVDEWERQPWVWDGILPQASLSLLVGKSETGKSTLIYSLIYCVVKGLMFFGRQCRQGRVIYLAGDPTSEIVAGKVFRDLGLGDGDDVITLRDAVVATPNGMQQLRVIVKDFQPSLIVGDTMATVINIDTDKYAQSYQAQLPVVQLAREFKPNFLMSHHSQKSAVESYNVIDAALGSVGIAAVASTRMATRKYKRRGETFYTWEMSSCRIGTPIEGEYIVHKAESGLCDIGGTWGRQTLEMDKKQILERLEKNPEGMAKRTLWHELRIKPKWAAYQDALDELLANMQIEVCETTGRGGTATRFRLKAEKVYKEF